MSYYVSLLDPVELLRYPKIPGGYADIKKDRCIILGVFEDEAKYNLLGCVIAAVSAQDTKRAILKYLYIKESESKDRIFVSLIYNLRAELITYSVNRLYFNVYMIDGQAEEPLTQDLIRGIPSKKEYYAAGYFVQDICDSAIMVWRYQKMDENVHVGHFYEYSSGKCRNFLKKLGKVDATTESPYSRFYMMNNSPIGAVCMEQPDDNTIVISSMSSAKGKKKDIVYAALLTGALSDAFLEHGLEFRILFRSESSEDIEIIEKYLGESTIPVTYKSYFIPIQ